MVMVEPSRLALTISPYFYFTWFKYDSIIYQNLLPIPCKSLIRYGANTLRALSIAALTVIIYYRIVATLNDITTITVIGGIAVTYSQGYHTHKPTRREPKAFQTAELNTSKS
jgi:hypothetical protein